MKIALVCSHGGHLTEMLYLVNALKENDIFFITYDNPRTRNLNYRKYLFPNFGERPFEVVKNISKILSIFVNEKPQIIISNGAEIAVPFFYISKLFRIKTIFIECYTRINEPTITGRLVYLISDSFIVLWPEMLSNYGKKAKFLGNFFETIGDGTPKRDKKDGCIFVTVGMHFQGFDRLIRAMDDIANKIEDKVIMQIGNTNYKPKNAQFFSFAEYEVIKDIMKKSKVVVCQGAMSAIDALTLGTPVIVVPRSKDHGEVINDHQSIFAEKLKSLGLIKSVEAIDDLDAAIYDLSLLEMKTICINEQFANKLKNLCNN